MLHLWNAWKTAHCKRCKPNRQNGADSINYLHTDHLNTPRLATGPSQSVTWRWEGDAFGQTLPQSFGATVNLRFPGQYYDLESGLHYNWERYYDSKTGRYITSDPIGLDGGLNTYGYVGGNPVNFTDPTGLYVPLITRVVLGGAARYGFPNAARMAAEAMGGGVIACVLRRVTVQLRTMKVLVMLGEVALSQVQKRVKKQEVQQIKEKKTAILIPQTMILII